MTLSHPAGLAAAGSLEILLHSCLQERKNILCIQSFIIFTLFIKNWEFTFFIYTVDIFQCCGAEMLLFRLQLCFVILISASAAGAGLFFGNVSDSRLIILSSYLCLNSFKKYVFF